MAVRRSLPPRPTFGHTAEAVSAGAPASAHAMSRPARLVEREAPYLIDELKRIALVSGTCIALLIALAVVDRLR